MSISLPAAPASRQAPGPERRRRLAGGLAVLIGVLLAATGCTRLLLGQLDSLAVWYVDGYVDLTRSQEQMIREIVIRNLAWFRQEELPKYIGLVKTVAADISGPVSPGLVEQRYLETETLWNELRRRMVPELTAFARTLSDGQVEEFFAALAEDNEELAEEYSGATPAERRHRQDRMIQKNLRRMVGRLSPAQTGQVLGHTARFHDLSAEWLGRRASWQAALRGVLERRQTPGFEASFGNLLMDTQQFDSSDYRRQVAENRQQVFIMLAELATSMTQKQREHFRGRLDEFARDLAALAVAPRNADPASVTQRE